MAVQPADYEALLAQCSHYKGAISLLKRYRPYLETLPSMRRPQESVVTIPLPNICIRQTEVNALGAMSRTRKVVALPCDLALLMCDPEWKIKTGVEIFIFIHRPHEDFSDILSRWRQAQQLLNDGYEWLLPRHHRYLLNEGTDAPYPLFVAFPQTPVRIIRGLKGAGLPVIMTAASEANRKDKLLGDVLKGGLLDDVSLDEISDDALEDFIADLEMEFLTPDSSDERLDERLDEHSDERS